MRLNVGVSSVSYVGAGDYVVNFSPAMADANYATTASAGRNATAAGGYIALVSDRTAQSASAVQIYGATFAGVADVNYMAVHVFR